MNLNQLSGYKTGKFMIDRDQLGITQEEGNGIGLYLSRIIIQKEGGYIKVSSGSNGGSCFSMYLLKKQ